MRFTDTAVQRMLNALDESAGAGVGATHGSLHSTYSTTGTPEVSGGSYARQPATWTAAAVRSKAATFAAAFNVPAGTTVRWVGLFDALTSGNCLGMVPNGGGIPESFAVNSAGVTSNTIDAPSHGFVAGNSVVVWIVPGASLPSPLAEGTVYFVIATGLTADALQVSATSGGSAIDLTTVGSGFIQRIVEEVFGAAGTHTVTSATMTLD